MTVAELIAMLRSRPQDAQVTKFVGDGWGTDAPQSEERVVTGLIERWDEAWQLDDAGGEVPGTRRRENRRVVIR